MRPSGPVATTSPSPGRLPGDGHPAESHITKVRFRSAPMSRIVMPEREADRKHATRERRSTEAEDLGDSVAGWRPRAVHCSSQSHCRLEPDGVQWGALRPSLPGCVFGSPSKCPAPYRALAGPAQIAPHAEDGNACAAYAGWMSIASRLITYLFFNA